MSLAPGTRLGAYEVVSLIGAGGMGEVYRARDTRLNRDVAIKVLPDAFVHDADRLARFKREAQVLASLNHPHIAAIYGLEEGPASGGSIEQDPPYVRALVLELVDGPTLADRIAQGPIPLDEALPIARQIAEALEAAHEHGVIHRDLKPANIKLTADGKVKVLDFGLAKAMALDAGSGMQDPAYVRTNVSMSPTITSPAMTTGGVILGTAAYMSPEQARGKVVDKRTDIWAFGCVLFEMLAGKSAFAGEDVSLTLSKILQREPEWAALPPATPPQVGELLRRCLKKEPRERLRDIGDARIPIGDLLSGGSDPHTSVTLTAGGRRRTAIATAVGIALGALVASLVTWWMVQAPPQSSTVARATIDLPEKAAFLTAGAWTATNIAISPDGTHVVYVGSAGDQSHLYLRPLDRPAVTTIAGTESGLSPFFSPDGQWIGFFADGKLKKVPLGGGPVQPICDAAFGFGAAWSDDGTIVFAGTLSGGLSRVSADGGQLQSMTTLAKGELSHRWPSVVPGTGDLLFSVGPELTNWGNARVAVQRSGSSAHQIILDGGTTPRYASTGHLVFARSGSLLGIAYDRDRRATIGSPIALIDGVRMDALGGRAQYALSAAGTLVYLPGGLESVRRTLVWVDRQGRVQALPFPSRGFERPRMSPDGRQIALTIREGEGDGDVWVLAMDRGTSTKLTYEMGEDESPEWSSDGKRVTYSATRGQNSRVTLWKAADGSGAEEQLFTAERHQHLVGWTPDGRTLVTDEAADFYAATLGEKGRPRAYLETPFVERGARLSPDGRWIAYNSNESGRNEVYVQAFPGPGGKWPISVDGGIEPMWARSGRELFYRSGDKMMAVDIQAGPTFKAGAPRVVFEGQYARVPWGESDYDVSPDGGRFLMIKGETELPATELQLIVSWFEELKRRVRPVQGM